MKDSLVENFVVKISKNAIDDFGEDQNEDWLFNYHSFFYLHHSNNRGGENRKYTSK
jgi:hypothetical protein